MEAERLVLQRTLRSTTTTTTFADGKTTKTCTTTSGSASAIFSSSNRQLHTFERLHQDGFAYLADNSYIRSGYRLNYSVTDCIKSLFELHNETLNVWTHMVGSLIFVSLIAYLTLSSDVLGAERYGVAGGISGPTGAAWCAPAHSPYVEHGLHTPRMLYTICVPEYCPRALYVRPDVKKRYYEVASIIFEHNLHQIPSLERFQTLLEENLGGLAEGVDEQMGMIKDELLQLQTTISHVADSDQIRMLKQSLNARVEGFSIFLQSIATHVGADVPMKYALDELHGLAESVQNGLHVMSTVDTHHVPHWPILVFMVSAVICLTCSATFHLLFVYSKPAYFFLSRLDYAGITILIAGSFYPVIYYSFYCHPTLLRLYLTTITTLSAFTFVVSLVPAFATPKWLLFRTCIFLALGFFGLIPVGHLVYQYGLFDPHVTVMIGPLLLMGALYTMGAIIYATKFPERFYPGRFDVWFSSHNLWHIFVVAAALVHFMNALQQYEWRWNTQCDV